jgi:hypothetical protein
MFGIAVRTKHAITRNSIFNSAWPWQAIESTADLVVKLQADRSERLMVGLIAQIREEAE